MNPATRGIRNAFRNSIRTLSITLILGLSIGLALTMLVARQAVQKKIESVKTSVGTTISISPAGAQGFQGGGEPLTTEQLKKVSSTAHVTKLTESLSDRLTADNTNLVSAIEPGTLGQRQAGNSGVGFQAPPSGFREGGTGASGNQITRTFTPPVVVTGVSDVSSASIYGGDKVSFTAGQAFDPTKDTNVAVVGKTLADKNKLSLNATFTAYGKTVKVVGIYDTGNTFANAGLLMPLPALQRLSGQTGSVTSATATVDSLDNLSAATSAIKTALGDKADITNDAERTKEVVAPLENVKSISLFSLLGALVAGAVIILLTMMMIVRERRREIGVMKAIGSSNARTVFQFMTEAVTLTVLAMVVGVVIGVAAANPVTKMLVDNSSNSASSTSQSVGGPAPGGGLPGGARRFREFGSTSVNQIKDIQTSVGWSVLAYGAGAALLIAIVGSAIPAFLISKVRPAEVMRAE